MEGCTPKPPLPGLRQCAGGEGRIQRAQSPLEVQHCCLRHPKYDHGTHCLEKWLLGVCSKPLFLAQWCKCQPRSMLGMFGGEEGMVGKQ